jgi:hypothetical protein
MNDLLQTLIENAPMLVAVAIAFLVIYKTGERAKRLADAVEAGLVNEAIKDYKAYAMATMYALAASLQALSDVAASMGWHKTSAVAKVILPGVVAVIAYVNKTPERKS